MEPNPTTKKKSKAQAAPSRVHVRRVPERGTAQFTEWRQAVAEGVRQSKLRRRSGGLLTVGEAATLMCLPPSAARKLLPLIQVGGRSYVRLHLVRKWLAETDAQGEERIA
jgi:hypothetical protein